MKKGSIQKGGLSASSIVANSNGDSVTITIPKSMLSSNFSNADGGVTVPVEAKNEGVGAYKNMIFVGLIGVVIGYIATKVVK